MKRMTLKPNLVFNWVMFLEGFSSNSKFRSFSSSERSEKITQIIKFLKRNII